MSLPKIIGLSGTFASGKDTLAQYFEENFGYKHISTGDIIREEATKRYNDTERETLRKIGNELRAEFGAGVLVEKALANATGPLVISGIRSIGEAKTLHEAGGKLVFIDAKPELRYERMKLRQRDKESQISFEKFLASEQKENNQDITRDDVPNISALREIADTILDNSSSLGDFFALALKNLNE